LVEPLTASNGPRKPSTRSSLPALKRRSNFPYEDQEW
jgi:hypothetical protein